MGNKTQPTLDSNRHWEAFCENKHDKLKVLSGEPLDTTEMQKTQVVVSKNMIVIAVCAVICNADGWADMRTWAETHRHWLQQFLQLPGGLPSRDTLRRTLSRIDPQAFQQAFLKWLKGLRKELGNVIAIDGKTLRGSKVGGVKPLHIVSAWASDQHLTLGQTTINVKSNEITAIPKLLESLTLSGAIVTIDAMGCQRDIAAKIITRRNRMAAMSDGFTTRCLHRSQSRRPATGRIYGASG